MLKIDASSLSVGEKNSVKAAGKITKSRVWLFQCTLTASENGNISKV